MPFFKAAAKRPPTPAPVAPAAAVAAVPLTVEALGQQLREVLPTRRLQSVSLCDQEANVLWLSEGALGPDEHNLVMEALMLLAADTSLPSHEIALEDGRLALFLPVRAPGGDPVGIAMILADRKSVGEDTLERIAAGPVRGIMQRLAVLLKPTDAHVPSGTAPIPILEFPSDSDIDAAVLGAAPRVVVTAAVTPVVVGATPVITAEEIDDILEFELTPEDSQPMPALGDEAAHPFAANRHPAIVGLKFEEVPAQPDTSEDMLDLDFEPPQPAPVAKATARVAPPPAPAPVVVPTLAPVAAAPAPKAPPAPVPKAAPAPPVARLSPAPRPPPPAPAPTPAPAAPIAVAAPAAVVSARVSPAVASDPNLMLELLPFAKLRAGGQTRRFQVLARSASAHRDPAAFDALVLQRLLGWLSAHRAAWSSQPTSFTVNLSIATLEDEKFVQKIAAALNSHGIAADAIGFEIAEALCTQRRAQVERFITQCDKIGSWVVMDDFSFDSTVLPLLRSKALRLVKIDAKLSSSALKDKLSQAMVVATVQAAKVLGIHCAAKRVDSQAALQWLTAIGCDFAQGAALAGPQTLDSLASSSDPTGISAMSLSET